MNHVISASFNFFLPLLKGTIPMAFLAHYPRAANENHLMRYGQIDWNRYQVQSSRVFFYTSHFHQNFHLHFSSIGSIFKLACDFLLNLREEIDKQNDIGLLNIPHRKVVSDHDHETILFS